jgi:hypothetical protein
MGRTMDERQDLSRMQLSPVAHLPGSANRLSYIMRRSVGLRQEISLQRQKRDHIGVKSSQSWRLRC